MCVRVRDDPDSEIKGGGVVPDPASFNILLTSFIIRHLIDDMTLVTPAQAGVQCLCCSLFAF